MDFVHEAGTFFPSGGGILDIFSFGSELPFRIELFEDEVEQIRMFDPATQLSVKKMNHISLVPNLDEQEGKEEKITFFEYLSPRTLIFAEDLDYTQDVLNRQRDKMEEFLNSSDTEFAKKLHIEDFLERNS